MSLTINTCKVVSMNTSLSVDEFLDRKRDFSPLLVHLTRDDGIVAAKDVLTAILDGRTLQAYNHFCLFSPSLKSSNDASLEDKFKVVCFTETPIDQIDILLSSVKGRNIKLDPYGLVFKKKYIKHSRGNPVFYVTKKLASPLWTLYWNQPSDEACRLLALVSLYDERIDFHWEREWRIAGDLVFSLDDIYCGLCPQDDIDGFESSYEPVKFISPHWGINKILDRLVSK